MEKNTEKYKCKICGAEKESNTDTTPSCCGEKMTGMSKLPPCNKPRVAEDARMNDDDEPCNEFLESS